MSRLIVVISLSLSLLGLASAAEAQQPGQDACARDASRFCRARLGDGDQVVLACLKEHRARLSKGCDRMLTEHGQ
jgi:cysteine rich repeat protein